MVTSFHPLKSGRDFTPSATSLTTSLFPSPQVGSGLICPVGVRMPVVSFHPLKSGRDPHRQRHPHPITPRFHPLKSGRDRGEKPSAPKTKEGFHPLKSGRDTGIALILKAIDEVSIPSSRVGTSSCNREMKGRRRFPSPQVGSGHSQAQVPPSLVIGFHPLKSGRDG